MLLEHKRPFVRAASIASLGIAGICWYCVHGAIAHDDTAANLTLLVLAWAAVPGFVVVIFGRLLPALLTRLRPSLDGE